MTIGRRGVCLFLAGGICLVTVISSAAQEDPSADQIIEALKPKISIGGETRALSDDFPTDAERQLITRLSHRQSRLISIDELSEVTEIVKSRPNIDLEINFDYNSAIIDNKAISKLQKLGLALRSNELKDFVFLIAGHTDAKGDDVYNQTLSERRADAVKRFLISGFNIEPSKLISIGYGKTQLKNTNNPFAEENRRVQIVNTEIN